MRKITSIILLVFVFDCVFAQQVEWQNTIGGTATDRLFDIQPTMDGGFIMGGYSNSVLSGDKTEGNLGSLDYWVVKLNSTGGIQWQNTIGGSGSDELFSVKQTRDKGYILGGRSGSPISGDKTETNSGNYDYWVIKLDSTGAIKWQNTIGGDADDELMDVIQSTDGGYVLGGYSYSNFSGDKTENSLGGYDYWVVKIDSGGIIIWQNTVGGNFDEYLYSIEETFDKGFILGGYSTSGINGDRTETNYGLHDFWLVKLDSSGTLAWDNAIGGTSFDDLISIQQTRDSGLILGGNSDSNISFAKSENCLGYNDYWVIKLDAGGNIQWENTIGGNSVDELSSIQQTVDGGYIIGGHSSSNNSADKSENSKGFSDYWVVKLFSSGTVQWEKTIGGSSWDYLYSIKQITGGHYIVAGYSSSDSTGDKTENSLGFDDYWILKLNDSAIIATTGIEYQNLVSPRLYPNPASSVLNFSFYLNSRSAVSISLYNILGETVFTSQLGILPSGRHNHMQDLAPFISTSGIYFAEISSSGENTGLKLSLRV